MINMPAINQQTSSDTMFFLPEQGPDSTLVNPNLVIQESVNELILNGLIPNLSKSYIIVSSSLIDDGSDFGGFTPNTTTSGIQEAINSIATTGGRIFLKKGIYYCNGSLSSSNSLITLPLVSPPNQISIYIEGEVDNQIQNEVSIYNNQAKEGVIIYAKNTAPSSSSTSINPYSILASPLNPNGYASYQNSLNLKISNICFMQGLNPTYSGINANSCLSFNGNGIQCLVDAPFQDLTNAPSNVQSIGIIGGGSGSIGFTLNNYECTGYYLGIIQGAHTNGSNWNITACYCAISYSLPSYYIQHFGNVGGNVIIEWTPNIFGCANYPIQATNNAFNVASYYGLELSTLNGSAQVAPARQWMVLSSIVYSNASSVQFPFIKIENFRYENDTLGSSPSQFLDDYITGTYVSAYLIIGNINSIAPHFYATSGSVINSSGYQLQDKNRYYIYDSVNNLYSMYGADNPDLVGLQIVDIALNQPQLSTTHKNIVSNNSFNGGLFRLDIRGGNPSTLKGLSSSGTQWYLVMANSGSITNQIITTGTDVSGNLSTIGTITTGNGGSSLNNISVGSSPFTFTNSTNHNIEVTIGGGNITAFSLNGTSISSGLTYSGITQIHLRDGDNLTVTYSSAPTMNYLYE